MPKYIKRNQPFVGIARCFYCGKIRVAIGDTPDEVKAKNAKVVDLTPCSACKKWMEQGVILITISDERSPKGWQTTGKFPSPYRTGGFYVHEQDVHHRGDHDQRVNQSADHLRDQHRTP